MGLPYAAGADCKQERDLQRVLLKAFVLLMCFFVVCFVAFCVGLGQRSTLTRMVKYGITY